MNFEKAKPIVPGCIAYVLPNAEDPDKVKNGLAGNFVDVVRKLTEHGCIWFAADTHWEVLFQDRSYGVREHCLLRIDDDSTEESKVTDREVEV